MKLFLKTVDHFLSKESFELYYDQDLELLRTQPQPDNLSAYYEADNYISHSDHAATFFEKVYQSVKQFNLKRKLRLVANVKLMPKTLLDIGAGTGEFLAMAKKNGWRVKGVEPNPVAKELARNKGLDMVVDLKTLPKEKFAVVTLWHVLEHMPALEQSIQHICDKVADGGTLIIAVPNYKSFDAKYYGAYWAAYDVPRHLWHFSKTAIEKLFVQQQFDLVQVKPMWFDAFYVSLLSETYKSGRKQWIKAISIGFWSNLCGLFTKEYSSHIYVLKKRL